MHIRMHVGPLPEHLFSHTFAHRPPPFALACTTRSPLKNGGEAGADSGIRWLNGDAEGQRARDQDPR